MVGWVWVWVYLGVKWLGVANLVAETLIKRRPDACFTAYALISHVLAIHVSLMDFNSRKFTRS